MIAVPASAACAAVSRKSRRVRFFILFLAAGWPCASFVQPGRASTLNGFNEIPPLLDIASQTILQSESDLSSQLNVARKILRFLSLTPRVRYLKFSPGNQGLLSWCP